MKKILIIVLAIILIPPTLAAAAYCGSFKYALTLKQSDNAQIEAMTGYGSEYVYKATLVEKWHSVDVEFLRPFHELNDMNQKWIPAEGMRGGSQLVTVLWVRSPPEKMKADVSYLYNGEELPVSGRYIYENFRYDEKLRKTFFVGKLLTDQYITNPPKGGYYLLQTYDLPLTAKMLPNAIKFAGGVRATFDIEMQDKGETRTAQYDLDLKWKKIGDMFDFLLMF